MKQIPSLNALKFIAALAVVLMHAKVPMLSAVVLPLCKLAVPLFLMISGYCLMDDACQLRRESIGRAIPRIAKVTVWANLLYVVFAVVMGSLTGDPWRPLLRLTDSHFWTDLVCFGGTVSGHLWYLMAYLQVLLFFWLFTTRRVPRWVYWCIPLGLLLNLVVGNYGFLFDLHTPYKTSRNFFTIALPCVALGMWLHEQRLALMGEGKRCEEKKTDRHLMSPLAVTCRRRWTLFMAIVLLYSESILYKIYCPEHTADVWLMTVPAAVVLLQLCLDHPEWGSGCLADWGKRWSLPIYIYHMMLLEVLAILHS